MTKKIGLILLVSIIGAGTAAADDYSALEAGVRALEAGANIEAIAGAEEWSFNPFWEAVREVVTAKREGREAAIADDWNVCLPEAEVIAALGQR
ncbi:MAG: hypothetical protein LBC77_05985 [Spirochaetaceae bacterium]|jgi:hypothetical protein|nr:hypothetical protein [Spirochaetaceae bacterium]